MYRSARSSPLTGGRSRPAPARLCASGISSTPPWIGPAPDLGSVTVDPTLPLHPAERALALALDGSADTLTDVADTLEPHRLCGYLFTLAKAYTEFFESCPVRKAEPPQRANRIALCQLTGRTLAAGLDLLGIEAPGRL
jgi:arginyl-tRNA synthetase